MTITLIISAVGMTLLFLALAFFYGLLSLMTALFKDSPPLSVAGAGEREKGAREDGEEEVKLQAAAIAVALARADLDLSLADAPPGSWIADSRSVSPWWALHHQRQLGLDPNTRRIQ